MKLKGEQKMVADIQNLKNGWVFHTRWKKMWREIEATKGTVTNISYTVPLVLATRVCNTSSCLSYFKVAQYLQEM